MRIGELSARTGASVRSIRHYEDRALITSARTLAGQRYFEQEAVERVQLIRQLLAAGLATRAIADVLPCLTDPRSQTVKLTERLVEERERLREEIRLRTVMLDALDAVIGTTPAIRSALVFNNARTSPKATVR